MMRRFLAAIFVICCCVTLYSQRVIVRTTPEGGNIQLIDTLTHTSIIKKAPFEFDFTPERTYFYRLRKHYFRPDSGYVTFNVNEPERIFVPTQCEVNIHWDVEPGQVAFTLKPANKKDVHTAGEASGSITIPAGKYSLTLKKKNYRSYHKELNLSTDSILILNRKLQYCPPRLLIALSGGISAGNNMAVGLTLGYGGVHGAYTRLFTTLGPSVDGDDFDLFKVNSGLYCPYSNMKGTYQSAVLGYQYYTPWKFYLQLGLGYGKEQITWLSEEDQQRHVFTSDSRTGTIFDVGLGYPFGRFYVGAALQSLFPTSDKYIPFSTISAGMLNIGVIL